MHNYCFRSAAARLSAVAALAVFGAVARAEESPEAASVLARHAEQIWALPMWPLWLCSLLLLTLIFERAAMLRASRVLDPALTATIADALTRQDLAGATKSAEQSETVVGRAWGDGLRRCQVDDSDLGDTLTETTAMHFKPLRRNLQGISTISSIAPLLGLLGTVIGMILVFDTLALEEGTPDKGELAVGIMLALFTTVFGLVVAIPGIIAGRYLSSRISRYTEQTEQDIDRLAWSYNIGRNQASTK